MPTTDFYSDDMLQKKYKETGIPPRALLSVQEYMDACANFYGILPIDDAWTILDSLMSQSKFGVRITDKQFKSVLKIMARDEDRAGYIMPKRDLFVDGDDTLLLISKYYLIDDTDECDLDRLHQYYDFKDRSQLPPVIENWDKFYDLYQAQLGKGLHIPDDLIEYADSEYYEMTPQVVDMICFLETRVSGINPAEDEDEEREIVAETAMEDFINIIQNASIPFGNTLSKTMEMYQLYDFKPMDKEAAGTFVRLFTELSNNTRLPANRGYTPKELSSTRRGGPTSIAFGPGIRNAIRSGDLNADELRQTIFAQSEWPLNLRSSMLGEIDKIQPGKEKWGGGTVVKMVPKVGPNDPCPCGSGKKYKKCCGRG